jgi:hypothetical protein
VAESVKVNYLWRPQLSDAGDEMVLEAAVNGRADAIVTFNRKDCGTTPAAFGIEMIGPITERMTAIGRLGGEDRGRLNTAIAFVMGLAD